jgi:hypothetical protein
MKKLLTTKDQDRETKIAPMTQKEEEGEETISSAICSYLF